jgi:hypothetical protein
MLASWEPNRNSLQQQDLPGMLSAGYFHPFSSRVAASVVGIDNDREGQRSGYQLPPVEGQNLIKIGSFLREQKFFTSSKLQRLLLPVMSTLKRDISILFMSYVYCRPDLRISEKNRKGSSKAFEKFGKLQKAYFRFFSKSIKNGI